MSQGPEFQNPLSPSEMEAISIKAADTMFKQIMRGPDIDNEAFFGAVDKLGSIDLPQNHKLLKELGNHSILRPFLHQTLEENLAGAASEGNDKELARNLNRAKLLGIDEEDRLEKKYRPKTTGAPQGTGTTTVPPPKEPAEQPGLVEAGRAGEVEKGREKAPESEDEPTEAEPYKSAEIQELVRDVKENPDFSKAIFLGTGTTGVSFYVVDARSGQPALLKVHRPGRDISALRAEGEVLGGATWHRKEAEGLSQVTGYPLDQVPQGVKLEPTMRGFAKLNGVIRGRGETFVGGQRALLLEWVHEATVDKPGYHTLEKLISEKSGTWTDLEILDILAPFAYLLAQAHKQGVGVIYNDVGPDKANHFYWNESRHQLKVIDWANAQFMTDADYNGAVRPSHDIQGLARLMYRMCTNRTPVETNSMKIEDIVMDRSMHTKHPRLLSLIYQCLGNPATLAQAGQKPITNGEELYAAVAEIIGSSRLPGLLGKFRENLEEQAKSGLTKENTTRWRDLYLQLRQAVGLESMEAYRSEVQPHEVNISALLSNYNPAINQRNTALLIRLLGAHSPKMVDQFKAGIDDMKQKGHNSLAPMHRVENYVRYNPDNHPQTPAELTVAQAYNLYAQALNVCRSPIDTLEKRVREDQFPTFGELKQLLQEYDQKVIQGTQAYHRYKAAQNVFYADLAAKAGIRIIPGERGQYATLAGRERPRKWGPQPEPQTVYPYSPAQPLVPLPHEEHTGGADVFFVGPRESATRIYKRPTDMDGRNRLYHEAECLRKATVAGVDVYPQIFTILDTPNARMGVEMERIVGRKLSEQGVASGMTPDRFGLDNRLWLIYDLIDAYQATGVTHGDLADLNTFLYEKKYGRFKLHLNADNIFLEAGSNRIRLIDPLAHPRDDSINVIDFPKWELEAMIEFMFMGRDRGMLPTNPKLQQVGRSMLANLARVTSVDKLRDIIPREVRIPGEQGD